MGYESIINILSMKFVDASYEILTDIEGSKMLKNIEVAARTCYKSEDKITDGSAETLAQRLLNSGHEAMIEFEDVVVRFVCDRGVSHEIVRHRVASYAQESTRYCNYSKDKFGGHVTFIKPPFWQKCPDDSFDCAKHAVLEVAALAAEKAYMDLIKLGATAQEARYVLPTGLKTEIVMKANVREWRHFFKLRTAMAAHPQMRELTIPLLQEFKERIPILFDDL